MRVTSNLKSSTPSKRYVAPKGYQPLKTDVIRIELLTGSSLILRSFLQSWQQTSISTIDSLETKVASRVRNTG